MLIAAYLVTLLCPYSHANHLPENPHHSCFPHLLALKVTFHDMQYEILDH
jgi:hypothetical protein